METTARRLVTWRRTAFCLLLLAVALGPLAHSHRTFPGDSLVADWTYEIGPWFRPIAGIPNHNNSIIVGIGGLLLVMALIRKHDVPGLLLFALAAALRFLLEVPKALVDRPRPAIYPYRDVFGNSSFPSGHVM